MPESEGMDPNQVVPANLPDETCIERLFPKCPPKLTTYVGKRTMPQKSQPKRQNKSKVHQYSRRELESRRNRFKSGNNDGDSSSSDEKCNKPNVVHKTSLYRTNSNSSSKGRGSGKYMASQSLLNRLQKSKSSYSSKNENAEFADADSKRIPSGEINKSSGSVSQESRGLVKFGQSTTGLDTNLHKIQPILRDPTLSETVEDIGNKQNMSYDNNASDGPDNGCSRDVFETRSMLQSSNSVGCKPLTGGMNSDSFDPTASKNFSNTFIEDSRSSDKVAPETTDREFGLDNEKSLEKKSELTAFASATVSPIDAKTAEASAGTADTENITKLNLRSKSSFVTNLLANEPQTIQPSSNNQSQRQGTHVDQPDQRDDEDYINLFVYDNDAHNPQQRQILPSTRKQPPSQAIFKSSRHRSRAKRSPNEPEYVKATNGPVDDARLVPEENSNENNYCLSSPLQNLKDLQAKPSELDLSENEPHGLRESANIITIQHQASQQLLTTDSNDGDVVRNDTSSEELCAGDGCIDNNSNVNLLSKEVENCSNKSFKLSDSSFLYLSSMKPSSKLDHGALGPVREQAEIDHALSANPGQETKTETRDKSSKAPPSLLNPNGRKFVPPGFPHRIIPQSSPLTLNSSLNAKETDPSRSVDSQAISISTSNHSSSTNNQLKSNFPEAKTKDGPGSFSETDNRTVNSSIDSTHGLTNERIHITGKLSPHLPIITEAQSELDTEIVNEFESQTLEQDLTDGLNRIRFSASQENNDHNESSSNTQRPVRDNSLTSLATEVESILDDAQHDSDTKAAGEEVSIANLRHHKIPNETSHYSLVRPINNVCNSGASSTPLRCSSIRFNALSDAESGPEDSTESHCHNPSARNQLNPTKSCESNVVSSSHPNVIDNFSLKLDDEMLPTTKTALIFPRLDEGLSSEPESCEDEVEDEDEKAMEADVDADDDEDEDDDDEDDDDEDDTEAEFMRLYKDPRASRFVQSGVECFSRQPQSKSQNRLVNSSQQHAALSMISDHAEPQQAKAQDSNYGGSYIGQDHIEQNDIKSMSNYSNQNGQSNFWTGITSQQPAIPSQPSSSQNFNTKAVNDSIVSKGVSSFGRDEAKSSNNRLSSDTDNETDRLLGSQRNDQFKQANNEISNSNSADHQPVSNVMKQNASSREVLIEGVLFNVKYLGSTHSDCEGRSEKEDRIHQAEMAVHEVKYRNGDSQPGTEVQLFISTEKIMVLDDKHRKIMMDHSLRTISYIADIGDAIVLIVRKKSSSNDTTSELGRPISRISCHVFESSESHTITKSISQAFQVAYTELLKANGTGDSSSYLPKELDYQEVLNSQEMSTDELEMFARKENQREVIVPKEEGEILGLSIVESGWGSVLPTVVIANLKQDGPAYRCKRLSIGDQILSVNGISLVGLPLAECQEILRKTKSQRVARLSVVPCPITVEVKIKRPDTKYQLGFSVQNGVICSLLRGGIAERGGVRVGHRIMSINGTTVVGVPHEKIVTLLASSVGEIRMKTCLTSLYRLILGEENPVHF